MRIILAIPRVGPLDPQAWTTRDEILKALPKNRGGQGGWGGWIDGGFRVFYESFDETRDFGRALAHYLKCEDSLTPCGGLILMLDILGGGHPTSGKPAENLVFAVRADGPTTRLFCDAWCKYGVMFNSPKLEPPYPEPHEIGIVFDNADRQIHRLSAPVRAAAAK